MTVEMRPDNKRNRILSGKVRRRVSAGVLLVLLSLCAFPAQVRADVQENAAVSGVTDVIDQVSTAAGDLYDQMDEAVDNFDKESLKVQIRMALEEMDRRGISPTAIARDKFGIKANPMSGIATGITGDLVESAERAVRQESQGPLQELFDLILGKVSDFVAAVAALIARYVPLPF